MDINQLDIESKLAQGSFGTLYKGTYCGQEVAVKILRDIQDDPQQYEEFAQVRHRCRVPTVFARWSHLCAFSTFIAFVNECTCCS